MRRALALLLLVVAGCMPAVFDYRAHPSNAFMSPSEMWPYDHEEGGFPAADAGPEVRP